MPAADGTFVPLARVLRAESAREPEVAPAEPAPAVDHSELARDVRVLRAQLADAFDASLASEVDALLAALLERLR